MPNGVASKSEAASSPLCCQIDAHNSTLPEEVLAVSAAQHVGGTYKWRSGDIDSNHQQGVPLSVHGEVRELCLERAKDDELYLGTYGAGKVGSGDSVDMKQESEGAKPANSADIAKMDRNWRIGAASGAERGKIAGGNYLACTSDEEPLERRGAGEERGGVVVMVVGMRDQERALKRSRSMIDAYRDNLAELQGVVADLHRETELENIAILEMEQQIVRKQAEHHCLQKKADEVRREVEALRTTVQERREALSLQFDKQYSRLECEEAKIRCSSIQNAVQILAGSQQLLDDAETEALECLRHLIHDGKKLRVEHLAKEGVGIDLLERSSTGPSN